MRTGLVPGVFTLAASVLLASACGPTERVDERAFPVVQENDALPPVGARVGFAHQLVWGASPDATRRRAAQLERLRSVGASHVRIDFTWHRLERAPAIWDFSELDPVIADATAAGISILAVACYGNPIYPSRSGAGPSTNLPLDNPPEAHFPPTDPAHYASYVAAIAQRYGDRVKRYELWNEQNLGYRFWRPDASGQEYARYARAATRAGKAACADCAFVVGGLSMPQPVPRLDLYKSGPRFLEDIYAEAPDLDTWIDGVAFHPYPMPKDAPEHETAAFPERFQGSLPTQARQMREVMSRHGRELPLWITENGWPTNPGIPQSDDDVARIFGLDPKVIAFGRALLGPEDYATLLETIRGVPEDVQARYLTRSVLLSAAERIPVIFLYGLDDYDIEPEINQESAFGVFRSDGTEKPAVQALRTLLGRFGAYRFAADVRPAMQLDESFRAFAFRDGARSLLAIWRWKDGRRPLRLIGLPAPTIVLDQRGDEVARADESGAVDLDVGPDVLYVEASP